MAGVDKIVSQILDKAREDSEAILAQAKKEADEIKSEAAEKAQADVKAINDKAQAQKENSESRTVSAIDLKKSQAMLTAKQEVIAGILDKAYDKLHNMDADAYFEMILKLIGVNAQKGEGEIRFSKRDLDRLPKDFADKINQAASANAGSLKLSDKPADIENGFILVYGEIEENCSLKGLFDAKHNELTDLVNKVIS